MKNPPSRVMFMVETIPGGDTAHTETRHSRLPSLTLAARLTARCPREPGPRTLGSRWPPWSWHRCYGIYEAQEWYPLVNIKKPMENAENHHFQRVNQLFLWTFSIAMVYHGLVGGWATPLKNMSSSMGMMIPNWMEKCSKIFQTTNWWFKLMIG